VEASEFSMPEPDVYVERPPAEPGAYPSGDDIELAVEVSVTTLAHDRDIKGPVYAEAGIPEYWIVVPQGSTAYLLRHTEPAGTTYRRVVRVELPDGIEGLDVEAVRAVR
jgi:Uma2 family endonuclease